MKKLDTRGFMMAELIITATIVLVAMASLYVSYGKICEIYKVRLSYYDTVALQRLVYYRDIMIENNVLVDRLHLANNVSKCDISNLPNNALAGDIEDSVFIVKTEGNGSNKTINKNVFNNQRASLKYKDYVEFLSISNKFKANYVMLIEKCKKENNGIDVDDCKYAYLEVYDGLEQ